MAVGERYAFIHAYRTSNDVSYYTLAGVFDDTRAMARQQGHDLDLATSPIIEMLVAVPPTGPVITIHMDGWRYNSTIVLAPTLMFWRDHTVASRWCWDQISTYLGPGENSHSYHSIIVGARQWDADPRLHVADWSNPDGAVEKAVVENAADWERRMKARAHAAMAKALGF